MLYHMRVLDLTQRKLQKLRVSPHQNVQLEAQVFMGLANYFVTGFSYIAKPLHDLTIKAKNFSWMTECDTAFSQLKTALTSAPVLIFHKTLYSGHRCK